MWDNLKRNMQFILVTNGTKFSLKNACQSRQELLDFWLSLRCKFDLCSSGTLRSVDLWLVTDVSGPTSCPERSVTYY